MRLEIEHLHQPDGWASPGLLEIADDGHVAAVHATAPDDWQPDERLAGFVIPGLPNLHSHAFQRALAGRTEMREPGSDDNLWTWRREMYRFVDRLGPDELRDIAAMVYLEMLLGGFTQVGEFHYVHRDLKGRKYADVGTMSWALAEAAAEVGIGLTLLPVLYRHGGVGQPLTATQQRFPLEIDEVVGVATGARGRGDPLLTAGVAPHSLRATTPDELRDLAAAWKSAGGGPVHIHVAERTEEVEDCRAGWGAPPIRVLLDEVGIDEAWCLVHATHAGSDELADVAASGATVALCPMTEATIADGLFPLPDYEALGGRWGIGTDSHYTTDAALEMRCLELGQRLRHGRRNPIAAEAGIHRHAGRLLVDRSLAPAASVLGAPVGAIEVGARADLVALDGSHPSLAGHGPETALDAWVLSGAATPIRDVMVAGRWVVRDGHHAAEASVRSRYDATVRRLFATEGAST